MGFVDSYLMKIFGDPNKRAVKRIKPLMEKTNSFEKKIAKLSDEKLKNQTLKFRKLLKEGKTLDDILPEAFATVREAAKRKLGERPFDVQVLGGIVLHQGKIAEMKTGEGKTLTSTMPVYLNALSGKGVHIITVNDYLARRDTNWMGAIFHSLGLTIGCIQHDKAYVFEPNVKPDKNEVSVEYSNLKEVPRKIAYQADITYGTNNEFGFDYLRDNMVQRLEEMVQIRDVNQANKVENHLNYAIVDEVDSILIDEARTPLIISAPDEESGKLYKKFAQIVPQLKENDHYNVDEKMRAVTLTEEGIQKVEDILGMENIYSQESIAYVHHLQQALKAQVLFKLDKDYVVKDGQVIIVDEFTGRLMPGRRFSEGLHQALEAKENVEVQKESKTLATITFQNYFRLYSKIAGMTGTAMTSAEEFNKVYKLDTVTIPTHRIMVRKDHTDKVFKSERGKFKAVTKEVSRRHKKGQPILIGTIAIEKSEILSKYLDREGIKHEILNAKNHEREAQIIANAGQHGAVTIATNMAGRGTDIKLGDNVASLGGLHILGTERHEARRIDDQLRGRAGRQGDPGSSQFFVSMEDELMRRFGSDKVKNMMDTLGIPEDEPIENRFVTKSIEKAQARIEGHNFDIRKHVLEYDDVMNKQREIIYQRRRDILINSKKIHIRIQNAIKNITERIVDFHCMSQTDEHKWNLKEISENIRALFGFSEIERRGIEKELETIYTNESLTEKEKKDEIKSSLVKIVKQRYKDREEIIGEARTRDIEKFISLRTIDVFWVEHLENMQYLREAIGLRGYGQRDPLVEYKQESYRLFQKLLNDIEEDTVSTMFRLQIKQEQPEKEAQQPSPVAKRLQQATYSGSKEPESFSEGKENKNNAKQLKTYQKVGRNDPCPCGSGKKYKRCHGK